MHHRSIVTYNPNSYELFYNALFNIFFVCVFWNVLHLLYLYALINFFFQQLQNLCPDAWTIVKQTNDLAFNKIYYLFIPKITLSPSIIYINITSKWNKFLTILLKFRTKYNIFNDLKIYFFMVTILKSTIFISKITIILKNV